MKFVGLRAANLERRKHFRSMNVQNSHFILRLKTSSCIMLLSLPLPASLSIDLTFRLFAWSFIILPLTYHRAIEKFLIRFYVLLMIIIIEPAFLRIFNVDWKKITSRSQRNEDNESWENCECSMGKISACYSNFVVLAVDFV